ncbi:hypothetical protein [Brunnivagina elsteri]|uniref:Uncharacterized protein n=1 Tax=Brunnivagina elsteri CCALA 953 TaxID=987040 RepID=A0A2A2TQG7_9CYAN|nr:hypothetical protein [Calothrix elsteri]PAX60761.1 hypothetical protein CK510_00160 [Calothrix elsteri CCALA 953]
MKIRALALASIIGLSLATAVVPQKSMAQLTNSQNYDQPNANDPFNNQGGQQNGFNMFQLLHNAQLGIGSYNPDAANEQRQQLDEAATSFFARQRQRMQQGNVQPSNQPGSTIFKLEPASNK